MGISGIFGFGKQEEKKKTPFRIPAEASALSTIIDAENRENYPKPTRYQEIAERITLVFDQLDEIISQGEHAEEALRIKGDLKKKMVQLTKKVALNKEAAKKEGNEDYVANNMEYLERKSMRDRAKTLFTDCLVAVEAIMKCCREKRPKDGTTVESATAELVRAMSALHNDYFKKQNDDKEIKNLKEDLIGKIEGLIDYFQQNRDMIEELGLEENAKAVFSNIVRAKNKLSEP